MEVVLQDLPGCWRCAQVHSPSCEAGPTGTECQPWALPAVPPELWPRVLALFWLQHELETFCRITLCAQGKLDAGEL